MNAEYEGIEFFDFVLKATVIQVVLTSHVWAVFGCMQINSPYGELKSWNSFAFIDSQANNLTF